MTPLQALARALSNSARDERHRMVVELVGQSAMWLDHPGGHPDPSAVSVALKQIDVLMRPVLVVLGELDEAGERHTASLLRQGLLSLRLTQRRLNATPIQEVDLALVEKLAADLEHERRYEDALHFCGVGRALLRPNVHALLRVVFDMRSACCCVALLDFEAADALVYEILTGDQGVIGSVVADAPAHYLSRALAFHRPELASHELTGARAMVLHALGRYLAAVGHLGTAAEAVAHALNHLDERARGYLDEAGLALFLAEIHLDCADVSRLDALCARWNERPLPAPQSLRWNVLRGQSLYLQGRFTDAELHLAALAEESRAVGDQEAYGAARFQRSQILATLNRVDEADALLDELGAMASHWAAACARQRDLIRARRHVSADTMGVVPTPAEEPPPSLPPFPPSLLDGLPGADDADNVPMRHKERVADQWSAEANAIHLDLHRGRLDHALQRFAWLSAWARALDSPLMAARLEYVWGVVAHYSGDHPSALEHADRAADQFAALGMPHHEWAACRVCCWALKTLGAPDWRVRAVQERSDRLLRWLGQTQSARDELYFSLNKWTQRDEFISRICYQSAPNGQGARSAAAQNALEHIAGLRDVMPLPARAVIPREAPRRADLRGEPAVRPDDLHLVAEMAEEQRMAQTASGDAARGVPMARLRPRWLPRDTAVLFYVVLPDRIEAFLMMRSGVERVPMPPGAPRLALWPAVEDSWSEIRDLGLAAWRADLPHLGRLSGLLGVDAIISRLPARVRKLVIVPDDILFNVPFAALPHAGAPLVQRVSLVMAPQLRWSTHATRTHARMLGVAVSRNSHAPDLDPLGYAVQDLDAVQGVARAPMMRLCDEHATRETVQHELVACDVAFFACHGEFRPHAPHSSGLCLHDAWLTVQDIQRLSLGKLDLAVLAACFGADVTVLPGRTLVGLPSAFLLRGAGHVVSSLWHVPDESGPTMMAELYQASRSSGPVEGLAAVQRRWLCERPPHEAASFVVYASTMVPRMGLRWWVGLQGWWNRRKLSRRTRASAHPRDDH
jgi:tetratricopeptide (TPR) repeat protein